MEDGLLGPRGPSVIPDALKVDKRGPEHVAIQPQWMVVSHVWAKHSRGLIAA